MIYKNKYVSAHMSSSSSDDDILNKNHSESIKNLCTIHMVVFVVCIEQFNV